METIENAGEVAAAPRMVRHWQPSKDGYLTMMRETQASSNALLCLPLWFVTNMIGLLRVRQSFLSMLHGFLRMFERLFRMGIAAAIRNITDFPPDMYSFVIVPYPVL